MRAQLGVAVIIVRGAKILLGLRQGGYGAGTWCCPGGHLEYGETVEECAVRETLEETGLNCQVVDVNQLGWIESIHPEVNKHYVSICTVATISETDEPELKEPDQFKEWRWVGLHELNSYPLLEEKIKDMFDKAMHIVLKKEHEHSIFLKIKNLEYNIDGRGCGLHNAPRVAKETEKYST